MALPSPLFPELGFGTDRSPLPLAQRIAELGRRLFHVKTARQMAARAGVTHRAAELWLEGRTGLSGEALAELLRSDIGLQVLEEVMSDARPRWWPAFRAEVRFAELEARAEAARVEMDALRREMAGRAGAGIR